jgi:hypothetical protein
MTYDEFEQLLDDTQVVVVASDLSDTRRIEQVVAGQFDDIKIQRLDLQSEEDRETLSELHRRTGWKNLPMVYINGDMVGGEWELTSQQQLGFNTCGRSTHGLAQIIGYCGLLPFVGLSVLYSMTEQPERAGFALSALLGYAAIILSFVGAIHWGRSLHEPHMVRSNLLQIISIVPVLLAWVALLVPPQIGLGILIVGFVLIYLFDRMQYREVFWMQRIRLNLTLGVLFTLLVSLLAAFRFQA